MRTVLLSISFILAASTAFAQEPNAAAMSCAAASDLVRQRGQVVLGTGPGLFERIVADQAFCEAEQTAAPAWVATSDQSQCLVGYHCRERVNDGR